MACDRVQERLQVVSGQVGERLAFVFVVGHLPGDEFLEIRGIIGRDGT